MSHSVTASAAVGSADGQWLRRLRGSGRHEPASHPPLVAEVTSELGDGPVAWAVDLGHEMATRIIAEIPALGGGQEPFETLRMGTESATLRSMLLRHWKGTGTSSAEASASTRFSGGSASGTR